MRSVNKVMMIGHLAADPEVRTTQTGKKVSNFPLATNRDWVSENDTNGKVRTDFHKVVAWGKLADIVEEHLVKGAGVYVEGCLLNRTYELPDKQKRFVTEIRLDVLKILTWKKQEGANRVMLEDPAA